MTSLKVKKIVSLQKKIFEEDESKNEEEENEGSMNVNSYRTHCEDVFYNVYRVLSDFRGENGVQLFFNLVFERLDKDFYLKTYPHLDQENLAIEYVLSIEVCLFSVKCMLDLILFDKTNLNIHRVIEIIIKGGLPNERIIIKIALQLFYDASGQLKFSLDLIEDVFKFILQFIFDKNLGKLSSQVQVCVAFLFLFDSLFLPLLMF